MFSTAGASGCSSKPAEERKPEETKMMEAWQKASTPGEVHKKLDPFVGTFDAGLFYRLNTIHIKRGM